MSAFLYLFKYEGLAKNWVRLLTIHVRHKITSFKLLLKVTINTGIANIR
jgi:hypothetical protein